MRRFGLVFLILAAAAGAATAAAAASGSSSDPTPSLEYRPQRVVIPEPKAPHPLPPKTVFAEAIGSFGLLTGSFDGPVDVARDERSSDFYVLDAGNSRVQKFDNRSNFKFSWGQQGIREGTFGKRDGSEFRYPTAIAMGPYRPLDPSGEKSFVYVVDTGNDRIQIFDKEGQFVRSWGSRGSTDSRDLDRSYFRAPRDITFDKNGFIWVLDSGNERVQIFDSSFVFQMKWDRAYGVNEGNFTDLKSIAWSDERTGYIYLFGAGCVVQQFKLKGPYGVLDGTLVHSWPAIAPESGLCVPARIEVDEKYNYLYVLDSGNSKLSCYNPDGLYRWTLGGAQLPFSKPLGFAVNRDGEELLVADTENNMVQKFTLR